MKNNNLEPTSFPMTLRFNEEPTTDFKNNLKAINVSLVNCPSMEELRDYLVRFATATWEDSPSANENYDWKNRDKMVYSIFQGKMLPSALETVRLMFCFENISYQDLTHILRYRTATFSVECSGDKWWTHKDVVVPTSIQNSPELYERFRNIVLEAKQLYCDMLDTKKISLLDARYILPRAMETYCWVSISLKDAMNLINHRIDKQIQPDSDNVLAYRMIEELIMHYPLLAFNFDLKKPSYFYINTARTNRSTNLFAPDEDNDIYEWNENDYVYKTTRENVNGTDEKFSKEHYPFKVIFDEVQEKIMNTRRLLEMRYGEEFFKLEY